MSAAYVADGFVMGEEPEKLFHCDYPGCTFVDDNEKSVTAHFKDVHKGRGGLGVAKVYVAKEGSNIESTPRTIDSHGYTADDPNRMPIDIWSTLKRILTNVGVTKKRDVIIELFQMEKDPTNLEALEKIMNMAEVAPGTITIALSLWEKYIERGPFGMVEEGSNMNAPVFGKSRVAAKKDLADFDAEDWSNWMARTQKQMMGNMMQMKMMEFMMSQFNTGGQQKKEESSQYAKLPPEVEAQLKELREIREAQKMRETIEPFIREVRNYREQADEAKRTGKNPILAELMEYAAMSKAFESMGSKDAADVVSQRAQQKLEELRIQADKEVKQMQLQIEQSKEKANALQLEKMQTQMTAQMELLRKDNEIASQSKAQDLVTVIKQAQEVQAALKQIGGETPESMEEKKLQIIGDTVSNVVEGLKPVLQTAMSNRGGAPPMQPMAPQQMVPPGSSYVPPPTPGSNLVYAKCPKEGCGKDFEVDLAKVDPKRPTVTCPNCRSLLELQPINTPPPQQQGVRAPPTMPGPRPTAMMNEQRRRDLLTLNETQLDDVARQWGIEPMGYTDKESLVDDLMKAAYGSA